MEGGEQERKQTHDDADPGELIVQHDQESTEPEDPRLVRVRVVLEATGNEDGVDGLEGVLGRVGPGADDVKGLRTERQVRSHLGDDRFEEVVPLREGRGNPVEQGGSMIVIGDV